MSSFVEQAVLKVIDQSTPQINRINKALAELFKTAKSLKSIKIDLSVSDKGLSKASAELRKLSSELRNLRSARVNISANVSGLSQATRQLQQLRAQAQRPITAAVATAPRGRAVPAPTGRGGLGGLGTPGYPRGPISVIGTVAVSNIGALGHAAVRGAGREAKEGAVQADVADTALRLRQMPEHLQSASETAIKQIGEEQKDRALTPSGQLFNRAQIAQLFAEALPVAKYDVAGAKALTNEMIELTKLGVAQGQSFQTARKGAIDYSKALEMQDVLFDAAGKFKPEAATQWFDTIRKVAPDIGEEMTGQFMRSAVKYARSSRYAMTPEALAGLLFTSEEMGPSSAGTAMNQALKNLSGVSVQKKLKAGSLGDKTLTELVGGKVNDPELQRQNMFQWLTQRAIPAMQKAGFDPQNKVDVGKFAGMIASDRTARDFIEGAINRSTELQKQIAIAMARPGDKATVGKTLAGSTRLGFEAVQAQFQSVLGETLQGAGQILLPAMEGLSGHMQTFAKNIEGARKGDPAAQAELGKQITTGGLGAVALSPLAKSTMAMAGQIAAPMGIMAGVTGAATATSPAAQSLNLAGVSLNSAAQALTGAAAALALAGGVKGDAWMNLLKSIPGLGTAIAGLELARQYGPLSGGQGGFPLAEYQAASPEEKARMTRLLDAKSNLTKALEDQAKYEASIKDKPTTDALLRERQRLAQAVENEARSVYRITEEAEKAAAAKREADTKAATVVQQAATKTAEQTAITAAKPRPFPLPAPTKEETERTEYLRKTVEQEQRRTAERERKQAAEDRQRDRERGDPTDIWKGMKIPPPPTYPDATMPGADTLEVGSVNRMTVPEQKGTAAATAAAAGMPTATAASIAEQKGKAAGMAGLGAVPEPAATDIGAQITAAAATAGPLMAAPIVNAAASFQGAFGDAAGQITAAGASLASAGQTAASTLQGAAGGIGSTIGAAAAAQIRSAVANVTISVQHSGSVGGNADKGTNTAN